MYGIVPMARKRMSDYEPIVGANEIQDLIALAVPLRGARVLHLTCTAFGSGAPEELTAFVPLLNDLGLVSEWQVVRGSSEFARANKAISNALGGLKVRTIQPMLDTWLRYNVMNADLFDGHYDFVVVHDPQPAGIPWAMRAHLGRQPSGKWIWHCHQDLASAQPEVWAVLRSFLDCCYGAAAYAAKEYVRSDLDVPASALIPPTIDPLGPRNMEIDAESQRRVIERYGVDSTRPSVCQIARFIKWSDPIGVIDAYRLAKRAIPELQLILVWAMPGQNAEVWHQFQRVAMHAAHDKDISLLSNLNEVGNLEQNVFQRQASVYLHRSLRKGFASAVAEASWKARPVVVDRKGVMPPQVRDGLTGYVVDTVSQMADRVVQLLSDTALAEQMGRAGYEHVRGHFLITNALRKYLQLFRTLSVDRESATTV
ncbi:MAG: glycosyltransferase [Chloroflexi bacterium]|nr:glycosyltransferase [Chloroflexota bacterium]